jgi:predicted O-linked N-acetylglucosamine transferase (SPINDLY family)
MMLRVFKSHSRHKGFKVHSFAHGPNDGSIERRIVQSSSDVFEDISKMSATVAAQTIAHYSIDILIDYDGIHDYNNIKVLALRPAAIQITWLGFAGTTGQGHRKIKNTGVKREAIEYIVTDRYISPPDRRFSRFYSEHMIIMPRTYQPQDGERLLTLPFIGSKKNERMLLLSKHFPLRQHDKIASSKWLICFNRPAKITPDAFEDWIMIMKLKINTYLVLMVESDEAKAEIQNLALYWGLDPNRFLIFQRLPRNEYYAILAMSDLFLDTRHYGSHTVASDAMLHNIPVVTLIGDNFAGRVASSLSAATKMDIELISYTRRSFVDNTVQILTDNTILTELSKKLMKSIGTCIFNDEVFTLHLEQAYFALHELRSMSIYGHLFFPSSTC